MKHTEDQLILRTTQVIDKNGYRNLSLRKHLTTGAFYKHFKDKDNLFKAVAQELSREFIEAIDFNSCYKLLIILTIKCKNTQIRWNCCFLMTNLLSL